MKINRITLISFQLPKSQHYFACLRFAFLLYFICFFLIPQNCPGQGTPQDNRNQRPKMVAPDLIGGTGWLNTTRPISLKDLRGKVVLLDFWTLCCINCIHTLPDLEKLEKKWGKELVVIGVHSPKFDNEKSTESIRKALLRYEVTHPVVNDSDRKIWESYGVESWPTLVLIDPEGNYCARGSGEGLFEAVDEAIAELVNKKKGTRTLKDAPLPFQREIEKSGSPLRFPGKVITDPTGEILFVADSTNHRIVCLNSSGVIQWIAGSGRSGKKDGDFSTSCFNDPQGMAYMPGTPGKLLVADRKNHLIREINIASKTVSTIAGTGKQGQERRGSSPALSIGLNSPWDLWLNGHQLFIAMAGHHQIWMLDMKTRTAAPFAGSGRETLMDGDFLRSCFAQPSGLTSDGVNLYVADSETSSIRSLPINNEAPDAAVSTVVGLHLFKFGDRDGIGDNVLLQHALGVAWSKKLLFVADTYNNKIKVIDPKTRQTQTVMDGFNEPGGIWAANGLLYIADTNAHRIVILDPETKKMRVVPIQVQP